MCGSNLSFEALGNRDAKELAWELEVPAGSTSGFVLMRSNLVQISQSNVFKKLRDSIIQKVPPKEHDTAKME